MEWIDNCAICEDTKGYTLFTVLPNGILEIRGQGWMKQRMWPHFNSKQQAVRIAERIEQLINPPNKKHNL